MFSLFLTLFLIIVGFMTGVEMASPATKNSKMILISGIIGAIIFPVIFLH